MILRRHLPFFTIGALASFGATRAINDVLGAPVERCRPLPWRRQFCWRDIAASPEGLKAAFPDARPVITTKLNLVGMAPAEAEAKVLLPHERQIALNEPAWVHHFELTNLASLHWDGDWIVAQLWQLWAASADTPPRQPAPSTEGAAA